MNISLVIAALTGLSAVIFGAIGDHALKQSADDKIMAAFETGIRYHLLHAILMTSLAVALFTGVSDEQKTMLRLTIFIFLGGIFLFSGSIYLYAFTGIKGFTYVTPFGGITLMAGWTALIYAGWRFAV